MRQSLAERGATQRACLIPQSSIIASICRGPGAIVFRGLCGIRRRGMVGNLPRGRRPPGDPPRGAHTHLRVRWAMLRPPRVLEPRAR